MSSYLKKIDMLHHFQNCSMILVNTHEIYLNEQFAYLRKQVEYFISLAPLASHHSQRCSLRMHHPSKERKP